MPTKTEGGRMQLIARLITLMAIFLGQQALSASPPEQASVPETATSPKEAMFDYLRPILVSEGQMARVYFAGSCEASGDDYAILFPPIRIQAPASGDTGLAAIRGIFRGQADVSVVDDGDGIFRIVIGQVPRSLLETKIPVLALHPMAQYTPNVAIWAITDSKEVIAAWKELGVSQATAGSVLRSSFAREPTEGFPHLPDKFANVTADHAFDAVATTFGGIVVYGTCAEQARFDVYFVRVRTDLRR